MRLSTAPSVVIIVAVVPSAIVGALRAFTAVAVV
jgi:hypothetical protein